MGFSKDIKSVEIITHGLDSIVKDFSVSDDGTSLTFKMPASASPPTMCDWVPSANDKTNEQNESLARTGTQRCHQDPPESIPAGKVSVAIDGAFYDNDNNKLKSAGPFPEFTVIK
jgi:hypothetical protein